MASNKLNLTFHKIVNSQKDLRNRYDFVFDSSIQLINGVLCILKDKKIDLVIFLDDGYVSQCEFAKEIIKRFKLRVFVALISGNIGMSGYMSKEEILELGRMGVQFCSHGVSHAALGRYEKGNVMSTPSGGRYANLPPGHKNLLSLEGVRFQIIESAKQLLSTGIKTESFVYPYGIYNDSIERAVKECLLYKKAYTCDDGVESRHGSLLAIPRYLAYSDISIEDWLLNLKKEIEKM